MNTARARAGLGGGRLGLWSEPTRRADADAGRREDQPRNRAGGRRGGPRRRIRGAVVCTGAPTAAK